MSGKRPAPTKRERARNEQALKELLKVPGNDRCADCNAMNPGWASWSIGVFLCTRCASIHRKLGTHISKVKSLSLDNWESDQVDVLRLIGNIKANAVWNPDPSKHPIPLNTEESDSVMERYVRNKYEYKLFRRDRAEKEKETIKASLSGSRDSGSAGLSFSRPNGSSGSSGGSSSGISISSNHSSSSYTRPHPPNRSVSASFHRPTGSRSSSPPSKIGQVLGVEPVHQQAALPSQLQQPTTAGLVSMHGVSGGLEDTIRQLRDMGFTDDRRTLDVLKQTGGNVQTAIEILTRMGGFSTRRNEAAGSGLISNQRTGASTSSNPFDELDRQEKLAAQQQAQQQQQLQQQQQQILQQQQQLRQASLGVSNPYGNAYQQNSLFPHRTGPEQLHASNPFNTVSIPLTPTIPSQYQQHNLYSPFAQSVSTPQLVHIPIQTQSTGLSATNPYSAQASPITGGYNPFLTQQQQVQQQQQQQFQMAQQTTSPFGLAQPTTPQQQMFMQQSQQQTTYSLPTSPNGFFNTQQGLHQPQQLLPQPTGRLDKSAILSLYNMPHLAPTPPQKTQPDPQQLQQQQQQYQQQQQQQQQPQPQPPALGTSNTHLQNLAQKFANTSLQGQVDMHRSNSAPVLTPQSNNPFQQQQQQAQAPLAQQNGLVAGRAMGAAGAGRGHMTQESIDFGNWMNQSGRHSPDAFASLSFRQM